MMSSNTKMVLIPLERYEILMKKNQSTSDSENVNESNEIKEDCVELSEQDIISFIPEQHRNRAKMVLRHMKVNNIHWNKCGQLVLDNDCVTDANIIEVLRDVVSIENDKIEYSASRQFYKILVLTHFPLSLLRNHNGGNSY
jgi:hypothetical protein